MAFHSQKDSKHTKKLFLFYKDIVRLSSINKQLTRLFAQPIELKGNGHNLSHTKVESAHIERLNTLLTFKMQLAQVQKTKCF